MVIDNELDKSKIEKLEKDFFRIRETSHLCPVFHLMPPVGWLNDPNGLCQLNGINHIFFQYSPYSPRGAEKYWGHYETNDFVSYRYSGIFLSPDSMCDKDGVFSGSALVNGKSLDIFYTGNVEGENGSSANTIKVSWRDGVLSDKNVVIASDEYPDTISNQVRDPKVWKDEDGYHMVLGAGSKDLKGCVLTYVSSDGDDWRFDKVLSTEEDFGYMWECPDIFRLGGRRVLSCSPQGLDTSEYRFQNKYQSGYFSTDNEYALCADDFCEWDYGFDFYAPQTYLDESGRRILIGWMGVSDQEYDHDPSIEEGWQHMLTMPRQLVYDEKLCAIRQVPLVEYETLRAKVLQLSNGVNDVPLTYELNLADINHEQFELTFDEKLKLMFNKNENVFVLKFLTDGYGREERRLKVRGDFSFDQLRAFVDKSCVEIFINEGLYTFTTKLFMDDVDKRFVNISGSATSISGYELNGFIIDYNT